MSCTVHIKLYARNNEHSETIKKIKSIEEAITRSRGRKLCLTEKNVNYKKLNREKRELEKDLEKHE